MTETISPATLVVRRLLSAPRERVFAAWLDPTSLALWMCPGDATRATATVDARVGGRFEIVMHGRKDAHHDGEYLVIDPPSRLSFTWKSAHTDYEPTTVTIELFDRGGRTELVLTHRQLPSSQVESHTKGWATIVRRLEAALHPVVSPGDWLAARKALLEREKAFTRERDELSQQRRDLPWEQVEKPYVFETPGGKRTLPQLFDGRSQLVVYHFMFGPDWEAGCPHCSFWADNFNGNIVHLQQRDVTLIAVSRAPLEKLERYRQRMGWTFTWASSFDNDFNFDYHVSFTPEEMTHQSAFYNYRSEKPIPGGEREGISVFYKDAADRVFHTYSAYARGIDMMNAAYHYLDLVPMGRDEAGHDNPQFWVRRRDEYAGGR